MPQLKDLLSQQISLPLSIEASLPMGAPKVSQVMTSIAQAMPQTPEIPIAAEITRPLAQIPQLIKGIEFPKMGGIGPVATPAARAVAEEKATVGAAVGGYRPISTGYKGKR